MIARTASILLTASMACTVPTLGEDDGWTPLFDGSSLDGWTNPYDRGTATVENGEIRLTSDRKFFLVTEHRYADFVFEAEILLPEGKANSGFMFRCHVEPNRVYGYQAEVDGSDRRWSGGLYDEGRRKWLWPSKSGNTKDKAALAREAESQAHFNQPRIRDAFRRNEWNKYRITCKGSRLIIEVNDVLITDYEDSADAVGHIAIQHHGEKGQTYRFRNLRVRGQPVPTGNKN